MSIPITLWYDPDNQFSFETAEKAVEWRKDVRALNKGLEDIMANGSGDDSAANAVINQMRNWLFGANRFVEKWGKDLVPKDFQRSINATETFLALPKTKWD